MPSASALRLHRPDIQTATVIAVAVKDPTRATVVDHLIRHQGLAAVIEVVAPVGTASAVSNEWPRQPVPR